MVDIKTVKSYLLVVEGRRLNESFFTESRLLFLFLFSKTKLIKFWSINYIEKMFVIWTSNRKFRSKKYSHLLNNAHELEEALETNLVPVVLLLTTR